MKGERKMNINLFELEPEKVLGVTEVSKKDESTIKINYLQVEQLLIDHHLYQIEESSFHLLA